MVTVKTIDRLVVVLVAGILLFGTVSWLRAMQQTRNHMMGTMPGMDPTWYLFGTLIAVSVVIGTYIISRDQLDQMLSTPSKRDTTVNDTDESTDDFQSESSPVESSQDFSANSIREQPSPVTYLPEDEQRVVEPILESPGLTQVELRGRSDFSKAKVSQTVSKLEDRGLIYREKEGRTYRVYPGELLTEE